MVFVLGFHRWVLRLAWPKQRQERSVSEVSYEHTLVLGVGVEGGLDRVM